MSLTQGSSAFIGKGQIFNRKSWLGAALYIKKSFLGPQLPKTIVVKNKNIVLNRDMAK